MKGYDEYNTILLPPRQPGEKLPQEVVDSFSEQQRKKEAEDKEKAEAAAAAQKEKAAEEGGEGAAPPVISTVAPSTAGEGAKAGSDVGEGAKDGKDDGVEQTSCADVLWLVMSRTPHERLEECVT